MSERHNLPKASELISFAGTNQFTLRSINYNIDFPSFRIDALPAHLIWRTPVTTVAGDKFCPQSCQPNASCATDIALLGSGGTIPTPVVVAPAISFETSTAIAIANSLCFVDHTALLTQSIVFVSDSLNPKSDLWGRRHTISLHRGARSDTPVVRHRLVRSSSFKVSEPRLTVATKL